MPAYGLTIGAPAVKHARATMLEGDFRRAMLNQRTRSDERIIPIDLWDAVEHLRQVLETGEWREARFNQRAAVT